MPTPFVLGPAECEALHALRDKAAEQPIDMPRLLPRLKTKLGKRQHLARMNQQTVELPFGYLVTYSVETGHPAGTCRHMSMSSPNSNRVPIPEAIWMVAVELGFVGSLEHCMVWLEELRRYRARDPKHHAVNVVQPVAVVAEGTA